MKRILSSLYAEALSAEALSAEALCEWLISKMENK
jgi:hypothetical protein